MARKTIPTTASAEAFIGSIGDERRRRDCLTLLAMMRQATGCDPVMWGTAIVGFGEHDYSYPDTPERSTRWFQTGFSPRKAAITVYLMGGVDSGVVKTLGLRTSDGGCLYLKDLETIDQAALQTMIEQSVRKLR